MSNTYLIRLQDKLNAKTHTLPEALQAELTEYVADKLSSDDAAINPLKKEILNFIDHLKTATIGAWVIGYHFSSKLPDDLNELVLIARLNEQAAFLAPSQLVSDCENTAAKEGFSAHVIFRQVACLEKALKENQVEMRYKFAVRSKITEWITLLYEKFALMMIEASSLEDLNTTFESVFDETLCQNLPKLKDFHEHVSGQIDYLDNNDFFDDFYKQVKLSDKYEFVFEFYQAMKERAKRTQQPIIPELRATMVHLFYQTINKAYSPCEIEKFNLMRHKGATIEEVFTQLQEWTKENWVIYQNTDFHAELTQKLEAERETYDDWQEVCDIAAPIKGSRPMFHAHCVKFAGDPSQDPKDVIEKLKLLVSPVKPKAPARILTSTVTNVTSNTTETAITSTLSVNTAACGDSLSLSDLYCNEELELEEIITTDSDRNTKRKRT